MDETYVKVRGEWVYLYRADLSPQEIAGHCYRTSHRDPG
jgi:transposase-like protein